MHAIKHDFLLFFADKYLSKDDSCVPLSECPCYDNRDWYSPNHISHPEKNMTW